MAMVRVLLLSCVPLFAHRLAAHGLNTATFSRRRCASARREAAEERDTLMMSYPPDQL